MALDSCINSLFEPGNIKVDPGKTTKPDPTPRYSGFLLTAEGSQIIIKQTATPPGLPLTLSVFVGPPYFIGHVLRVG